MEQLTDMIMGELKKLAVRLDKLDQIFRARTQGPGMTPRALNPQQAYQAAMTAYQMNQAKINQRRAHEAGFAPPHPDDVKEDLDEQRQQGTRDFNAAAYGRIIHGKSHDCSQSTN